MHLVHPPEPIAIVVIVEIACGTHPRMPRTNVPLHGFEGKVKAKPAQIFAHVLGYPVFRLVEFSHVAVLFMVKVKKVAKVPPITVCVAESIQHGHKPWSPPQIVEVAKENADMRVYPV